MGRDIVVTPRAWSPRGEAELTVRGKPMLVWQGIPGESCRVRVVHDGQNQDYAVFREPMQPSPHRVQPPCDRYHVCGGCPLMHLDGEGQREARRALVRDALDEVGLDDVAVGPVAPSPDGDQDFRWVVKLGVGWSDQGRLRVGAWGRKGRSIVPIPECLVAAEPIRRVIGAVAHHVLDLEIPPYDPITDKGVLRAIVIRGSRTTKDIVVTLVAGRRVGKLDELASRLVQEAAGIVGVALHLNDDEGNAIFAHDEEGAVRTTPLEGRTWIEETLLDVTYRITPGDFFQTNPGMAEVLWRDTLARLELGPGTPFVDLYSGVGGLALPAARITGWAIGVEEVQGAVAQARESAKNQGIHAEFLAGRVEEQLAQVARRLPGPGAVVAVNPARRGLEAGVVDGILALRPSRIAYVSCNPRALARDLARFRERGSVVGEVQLYDMFPNTAHVECVAVIEGDAPVPTNVRAPRRKVVGRPTEER